MKFFEVIQMAFQSIKGNRLRTILTVLGVVVGIFSIIVIMTIITMLQNSIEGGLSDLAQDTFQVQKYPAFRVGGHRDHEKYHNRADITLDQYNRLKALLTGAKEVAAEQRRGGKIVKYGNVETNPNIRVYGETVGGLKTNNWNPAYGRGLRPTDEENSAYVCLLGKDVVDKLFPSINPVGQTVRVDGKPLSVIGVLEPKPAMFGGSQDNLVVMPITTFQSFYGKYRTSVNIMVMAKNKSDYSRLIEAAIGYLRTIRKVAPGEENDFEIFSNESLIGQINQITGGIKIGAMVVSIIALLAAGVGIMNIMLVSVTERTREIGVRKAVGAKRKNIMAQFLIEAIVLCMVGGIIGIVLGVGIGNLAGGFLNAKSAIPYDWVAIGLSLCVFVGIVFGTYPAYKAANLDPIEALRHE
jgi:putative ABC transport system permease protein